MRFFNWGKSAEHRASYSNAAVDALLSGSIQAKAEASQTAAAATAVRAIADSFAVAEVTPISLRSVLTPPLLVDLVRRLLLSGNAVFLVDVDDSGTLALLPVSTFEVGGGINPSSWTYRLELPRPSGDPIVRAVPSEGVGHVKVNASRGSPWSGVSPLAHLSATALASLERSLGYETTPPSGLLMAMPDGAPQAQVEAAAAAISTGRGGISLMGTTAGGYGQGSAASPSARATDYRQVRYGLEVPGSSITLHDTLSISLLNAMGISEQLFHGGGGPGMREAARQLYLSVISPLSAVVVHELSRALNVTVQLDFSALRALDSSIRARGVTALVAAGMPLADAVDLMGLED